MMYKITIFFIFLVIIPVVSSAGGNQDVANSTIKEFNKEFRAVREDHLLLPVNYLEFDGNQYAYSLSRRFVRLVKDGDSFKVKKIKQKKSHLQIDLESSRGAKLSLQLYDQVKLTQALLDSVFPLYLRNVFNFGDPPESPKFCGNLDSKLLHLQACNHLPDSNQRVLFDSISEAMDQSYRKCPACFNPSHTIDLEGYNLLRAEALEESRLFEIAFPPIPDESLQTNLQNIGEELVEDYPLETAGYEYQFMAVTSELFNASSFPTGFVYVTNLLLELIEDPLELEFVLAHEIAHCEMRPLMQASRSALNPVSYAKAHYEALRHLETSADILALACLLGRYDPERAIPAAQSILAKLQFATEALPTAVANFYDTHPEFGERLKLFNDLTFQRGNPSVHFLSLNKNKDVLIDITVLGKSFKDEDTHIYLLVSISDMLNETVTLEQTADLEIEFGIGNAGWIKDDSGKKYNFKITEFNYVLRPSTMQVMDVNLGGKKAFDELDLHNVVELEIRGIPGSKEWVRLD